MRLFKYCGESGVYILGSGQLRLSTPNAFNDPFEFAFNVVTGQITKEALKRYLKRQPDMFLGWYERHRRGKDVGKAYEFYHSHLDEICDQAWQEFPQNIKVEQANACNRASDYWAVGCFARRKDSILMWSHYGEHHRGIVIEFDMEQVPFTRKRKILYLKKVKYSRRKPTFIYTLGNKGFERQFPDLARYKHERWRYEDEWRIIVPRATLRNEKYLPLPHQAIVSVTLGCRCSEAIEITVHDLLRQPEFRHVVLDRAIENPQKYKLEFVQIPR